MIIALGLELSELGMTVASLHIRFLMSYDMPLVSTTEFSGPDPARQVP